MYFGSNPDTSLHYYEKALKARRQVDDKYLMGGTLNTIGLIYYYYTPDLDTPISYFNAAAEIREEIGHWPGLGSTLLILGEAYQYKGELDSAIQCFERSYLGFEKAGNNSRMAEAKLHSGTLLIRTSKYPDALEHLNTSLELYRVIQDTMMLGDVYTQVAIVNAYLGDYETAIEHASKAFDLYEAIDEYWGLAGAYNHTGIVLQEVNRPEKAAEYYQRALEIYTELEDQEHIVIISNNLGTVEFDLGSYDKAEEYHMQALNICQQTGNRTGELPTLLNLANAQNMLGELDEARTNYDATLLLSKELNSPEIEWKVLVGIAENFQLRGDFANAIEYNEMGLSQVEELRQTLHTAEYKTSYFARERFAFEDVIDMLGEMHDADPGSGYDLKAFEYAQRCKSRSFLDHLDRALPASMNKIQESGLDKNTVMLEYILGDSCSYLWVITKDHHRMIRVPDRNTIEQQVETFRFALTRPDEENIAFLSESGYSLYEQLVQPVIPFIPDEAHLLILPDGILNYIPFEALITERPDPQGLSSLSSLNYLINEHSISYGQSSSVWLARNNNPAQGGSQPQHQMELIAFGDPVYLEGSESQDELRQGLRRLIYSGEEVKMIAALFEEGSTEIFLRETATEEHVKRNGHLTSTRYIHFATHGLIDDRNPENSCLVLSHSKNTPEDGNLRASEISGMSLTSDLVVLSACQTGLGRMVRGEGMIGLSRSFMYAGASSLIASLWNVSDNSTSILMTRFYTNLIKEGLNKAEALREARLSMIKDGEFAHPFYWAPFILTGSWE
jgi:CHAT domain-containing protein/Tfp pilus assembly protein PilF